MARIQLIISNELLHDIGTWTLGAAVAAGVVFLILYTVLARWWESATGWYIWFSSLMFTEILAYNLAAILGSFQVADPAVREWTRLFVYGQVMVVMAWRGVLLLSAQIGAYRAAKRAKKEYQ